MNKSRAHLPVMLVAGLLGAAMSASAAHAMDSLKILAAAAPGGGYDGTARAMQQALEDSQLAPGSQVDNVPGAAGAIGLSQFTHNAKGDGKSMMVIGYGMISSFMTSKSVVTLNDITPIARLTGEYSLVVVPSASKFHTMADVLTAMKTDIGSVSIAGAPVGGTDQILAGMIAEAINIPGKNVNYIPFTGSESVAALVGNQVSVGMGGYSSLIAQVQAGTLRALAISSDERVPGVDIPTLKEQGINVSLVNWRGIAAPPGITPEQKQAYLDLIDKMVKSDAWKAQLTKYQWSDQYLAGDKFAAFVGSETERTSTVLKSLGLIN
jgi:putative tricarboxylic transport membrane protein